MRALTFREHQFRMAKAAALRAERQDKRKKAMEAWRKAADYCDNQKQFFECRERALENLNAYNAKFKPFER